MFQLQTALINFTLTLFSVRFRLLESLNLARDDDVFVDRKKSKIKLVFVCSIVLILLRI